MNLMQKKVLLLVLNAGISLVSMALSTKLQDVQIQEAITELLKSKK